jgi:hypothetical protein
VIDPRDIGAGEDDGKEDDVERWRRMTPEERLTVFLSLCRLTDSIVRNRPDADALRAPTPRSPESEELWRKLMERRGR